MKFPRVSKPLAVVLLSAIWLTSCSSTSKRDPSTRPANPFKNGSDARGNKKQVSERELRLEADQLYRLARSSLDASDFAEAVPRYDAVISRYPFTEFAVQSELERVYAQSRQFLPDEAITAADRFLREHPRHPNADYLQYLKGVIQSDRDSGLLAALPLDTTKQDVGNLRKAYDEFSLLIQKYPNSRYSEDARARMLDLRNRIAENEMHVVRYYVRRGADLAAVKRAEQIIAQYPGAPATLEALKALANSYQKLGLKQQADDASMLLAAQSGAIIVTAPAPVRNVATAAAAPVTSNSPAPTIKRGIFTRIAGLFSFLDSSKHAPLELVIPSGNTPAATAAPVAQADGTAAPARKPLRLIVEINTGDEKAAKTAKPADAAATPEKAAEPVVEPAAK